MDNKTHGTTVLFLLIAALCTAYGNDANIQNTHVKFNITRTSKGDFVRSNIPLQCHTFRSSCTDYSRSGNWNCYQCSCMGSSTFQNYGIQVELGTELVPTGICTDGVQCGDGKHAMYLKSTQEEKALTAYNISKDTIDAIVGARSDFFMYSCILEAATVIQDPVNQQVTGDFVIKSYNIMHNVYELTLEWNIPNHARKFYEGRLVLMSADCGRGQKPCFYVKFQGTENYERILPTSQPVVTTSLQTTANTSHFSKKETVMSPNVTNATTTASTVVHNHTSNSSVITTGTPDGNSTTAATASNTTPSTATANVTSPEMSTTDRSTVKTTTAITSVEPSTLPKTSTTAKAVTAHSTTASLTTEEVTMTLTQSTVTTPAIYENLKSKKSSVKHWLIVLCICVIIIAIIVAVVIVAWMYWKRKKRYCYNGAPIFTRLERTSLDAQRPDFLNKDENFGFVDLRAANDNAGAERGDTDSRDGLVDGGSREFELEGEYQDFYTAVRETPEFNLKEGQYAVANNNEYQPPVADPRIDPNQANSLAAVSPNLGSINNYQPISAGHRSPSSTYEGLVPSHDHQYQSLKPHKDEKEYYAGLLRQPGPEDQNSLPVYAVLDYESVDDSDKHRHENAKV